MQDESRIWHRQFLGELQTTEELRQKCGRSAGEDALIKNEYVSHYPTAELGLHGQFCCDVTVLGMMTHHKGWIDIIVCTMCLLSEFSASFGS